VAVAALPFCSCCTFCADEAMLKLEPLSIAASGEGF
jgi:hypothetical protein